MGSWLYVATLELGAFIPTQGRIFALGPINVNAFSVEISGHREMLWTVTIQCGRTCSKYISRARKNAAIFERIATEKIIKKGELVIMDIGSVYRGYTGDIGRTICVGIPSKEQKEIYKVCYESLQTAISLIRPGVKCSKVDAAARDKIQKCGFSKYMHKLATGHQLGYGIHGEPLIGRSSDYPLKPNMIVCLEPRVTVYDNPQIGGVHLEDAVLVTEDGYEVLTKSPFSEDMLD